MMGSIFTTNTHMQNEAVNISLMMEFTHESYRTNNILYAYDWVEEILPVFSLISQRTLNKAGFIRWQFSVCFLKEKCSMPITETQEVSGNQSMSRLQLQHKKMNTPYIMNSSVFQPTSNTLKTTPSLGLYAKAVYISTFLHFFTHSCFWTFCNITPLTHIHSSILRWKFCNICIAQLSGE